MKEKDEIRKRRLEKMELQMQNEEFKKRMQKIMELHTKVHRPKAVVLMEVEEIYSTVPGEKYEE
ncbi:MAG: hypothetical protein AB1349_13465 [Elusimicrobiota bacterium]